MHHGVYSFVCEKAERQTFEKSERSALDGLSMLAKSVLDWHRACASLSFLPNSDWISAGIVRTGGSLQSLVAPMRSRVDALQEVELRDE